MRRMLIITSDKNNAVSLRTLLEKFHLEFEIAIGEETGRTILSERFMDIIVIEASTMKGGTSWVFSFLASRRLSIPVVVLGAAQNTLADLPLDPALIRWVPPPLDGDKIMAAIREVERLGPRVTWDPATMVDSSIAPLASISED